MNEAEYLTQELKKLWKRLTLAFILLDEYELDCGCSERRKCGKCQDKQKLMEEEQ